MAWMDHRNKGIDSEAEPGIQDYCADLQPYSG